MDGSDEVSFVMAGASSSKYCFHRVSENSAKYSFEDLADISMVGDCSKMELPYFGNIVQRELLRAYVVFDPVNYPTYRYLG